jgi:hypothetical protein
MAVRFDESLPILVEIIAQELGPEALSAGVVLRDMSGRLAFFSSATLDVSTVEKLSKQLREALGAYARSDRLVASANDFGVAEVLADRSSVTLIVSEHLVRLVDRRLVGADWLRKPAPVSGPPPRFVFASLKGGVGRSTALSVAAADIASRGLRVLAIDLDMEAPGLGSMLLKQAELPEFGLIDALVENGLGTLDDTFMADLFAPSALAARHGRIDVVPAFGQRSFRNPGDILAKIARAYAEDVRDDGTMASILDQVSEIVDHFAKTGNYHAILIDARAGLHETTATAVLGLGAEVFLFGLDEPQTFQGYSALFAHLARFIDPKTAARPEWLERITMVQGKASANADVRLAFAESCQLLYEHTGLVFAPTDTSPVVSLPAEPFGDVPWNDEVPDEELHLDEPVGPRPTIAILDDERFRLFDPTRRRDLLSSDVYRSSFGQFLDRIAEVFSA